MYEVGENNFSKKGCFPKKSNFGNFFRVLPNLEELK